MFSTKKFAQKICFFDNTNIVQKVETWYNNFIVDDHGLGFRVKRNLRGCSREHPYFYTKKKEKAKESYERII